jgi:hypothetical protein
VGTKLYKFWPLHFGSAGNLVVYANRALAVANVGAGGDIVVGFDRLSSSETEEGLAH